MHARTAMIGVAGILIPGVLTKAGVLSVPEWYNAGQISIDNSFAPFDALVAVQVSIPNAPPASSKTGVCVC